MKVYWGITASRSYRRSIPHNEAIMLSAMGLWNGKGFRQKTLQWQDWALDSGGFVALNKQGDYPFGPDDYLKLIEERKPSWAASMDYPCEPEISRGALQTTAERIDATVDYEAYLCERSDRVVPVIQGYTIEDYTTCIDLMEFHGVPMHRVAIGSLCRRQRLSEIRALAWDLRLRIPKGTQVHGFGVKLSALRHSETWALFDSLDTNAWEFWKRMRVMHGVEKMSDQEAWFGYSSKMKSYIDAPRQLSLGQREK